MVDRTRVAASSWARQVALASSLIACGESSEGGAGGAGALTSGSTSPEVSASGSTGGAAACPEGYVADLTLGARENQDDDCLDVDAEAIEVIDICTPLDEFDQEDFPFEYCFRRLSDQEEYWVASYSRLRILPFPASWEFCDEAPTTQERSPQPCFLVGACSGHTPDSTCAEGATRAAFNCGEVDSSRDESCCLRPFCDPSGACADGFECREIDEPHTGPCWLTVTGGEDPSSVDVSSMDACYCMGGEKLPQEYCFPVGDGG